MSIMKLAFYNFKRSFRNYLSMILSLAFTVLILFNFINLTYADTFRALGGRNKDFIDMITRIVAFVLACFMFFFIWYAANVFLTARKKEIGVYIFMGLTNRKIARLYLLETVMTGCAAFLLGIGLGVITAQLFQMILLKLSEIAIEISFDFTWKPVALSAVIYFIIYALFVLKGYINIVKSSVLEMISAARQNEYVKVNGLILMAKAALGVAALINGYYLAIKESGYNQINNLFAATVFVIAGTYLLFGGFLPILFQQLSKNKIFLYRKERNLWVNNVIFRMRKNYRTYAMTCVLLTCSVTALAASFATRQSYDNIVNFRNTYTFQILTNIPDRKEEIAALIEKDNDIAYSCEIPFFSLDGSYFDDGFSYGILSFSKIKEAAAQAGLEFPYEALADDEVIYAGHVVLMSFISNAKEKQVGIGGRQYRQIDDTRVPYLGYMQEISSYYIVSDTTYAQLLELCKQNVGTGQTFDETYTYNYRIEDSRNFRASMDELDTIMYNTDETYTGRVAIDPDDDERAWIKVEYSLCIFMFLVFVLASGSILFMKLYNDAFEEKERYLVLQKIGISKKALGRAVEKEMCAAYGMPFLLMMVSSYFSVHSLEKIMSCNLRSINIVSVLIILVIFVLFYELSVTFYKKNAGV
ncbi:MAG: ABC transporter permease [Bacillus sp. (in: Bacteria)]|nr:ABC transporter permease [Bacillus sp. (in: firmicutes)]MCM1427893.1 ABC transporter permease [Eubacterium sp.]